jgi:uncharacterized metal-binding protein
MMACSCSCGGDDKTKLIYACAGAANTGYLADQVARKLNREGAADMTCLAAVGADLSGFIESAKSAGKNIVIDGCPVACGKKIFEAKGLPFTHFTTTDFGVEKKKTEITQEVIDRVSAEICEEISD